MGSWIPMEQAALLCLIFYIPVCPEGWRVTIASIIVAAELRTAFIASPQGPAVLHALNAAAACLIISSTNVPLAVVCGLSGIALSGAALSDKP